MVLRAKFESLDEQIDLARYIPKKTWKGYPISINEIDFERLKLSYHLPQGGTKKLVIKRFVKMDNFGKLLGQLQAEGNKCKNITKKLVFTNVLVSEHKSFINSLEQIIISKNIIKVRCFYNSQRIKQSLIDDYIDKLEKETNRKVKFKAIINERITLFSQTVIERALLAEVILGAMNYLRNKIANQFPQNLRIFSENFLSKLLSGDGSLGITRNNYGRGRFRIFGYISDGDKLFRNDYRKILKNFKIAVMNYDEDGRVYFKPNSLNLIFLYKIKAFYGTNNWKKLLKSIFLKNNNSSFYKKFSKLAELNYFTLYDLQRLFNISYMGAKIWCRYQRRNDLIQFLKEEKNIHYYSLTNKAQDFLNILNNVRKDLSYYGFSP